MEKHKQNALLFKALSDEKRLTIVELLQHGERCACVLSEQTGIAQSALSYHMRILCESKLVLSRQDGKWTHYRLSQNGCAHAVALLQEITKMQEETCSICKSSS